MALGTCLIVPGIAGSELYVAPGSWPHPQVQVWLAPGTLLVGGWRALELGPDGVSPPSFLFPRLVGRGPLGAYYRVLASELGKAGWIVSWPDQDWRGQIQNDAARLVATIRDYAVAGPVSIVAHSRGGLVTRAALALLEQSGQTNLVARVVGLGVPHQGSLAAAQLLGGWDETITLLYRLLLIAPNILALGFPSWDLLRIARTWPAVYELLPQPGARWVNPSDVQRLYEPSSWSSFGAPISGPWLSAAYTRWAALPTLPAGTTWINVVGYGVETPVSLTAAPLTERGGQLVAPAGDGVVVEQSARVGSGPVVRVPVPHGALPYDRRSLGAVEAALAGLVVSDQTVGS